MKLKRTDKEVTFARIQGRRVYELRKARKITRRQLAVATGIHQAMLFRIEMGDSTASAFQLDALASALEAQREELFPSHRKLLQMAPRIESGPFGLRRAYA